MMLPLLLPSLVATLFASTGLGQDANWGKVVKCFVVQGTVVCPGCNARAGLACPVRAKDGSDFLSCEPPIPVTKTTTQVTTEEKEICNETSVIETENGTNAEKIFGTEPSTTTAYRAYSTKETFRLLLYLYRYLPNVTTKPSRRPRSAPEPCRWNGDCPCPLICCKRGRGCPGQCIIGLKLHPHVYPG